MKYTISVTQRCNLRCNYCYIDKRDISISQDVAQKIVDFAYWNTPDDEKINIGFFGGEPLLAFDKVREIVAMVEEHPGFTPERLEMTLVSNGTLFSDAIACFLRDHNIGFGVSCDGPPAIQDISRCYINGRGSGKQVDETLKWAMELLPNTMVNAVYYPQTLSLLPRVVEYFSDIGLRHIYLSPDFSAQWKEDDAALLPDLYADIGSFYLNNLAQNDRHFISLIDAKIAVIMRGGYDRHERCRMGKGEFAFSASGFIYPCERLIGKGGGGEHAIGHIDTGVESDRLACNPASRGVVPSACIECGIREYCMNWCGCSNFMSTGSYHRPGAFLCASERAAIEAAFGVIQNLENQNLGSTLFSHMTGEFALGALNAKPSQRQRIEIAH